MTFSSEFNFYRSWTEDISTTIGELYMVWMGINAVFYDIDLIMIIPIESVTFIRKI
tara:strand:- start:33570 stop:33737 length:168 start_codon:yes stop_codon:yes gene_type:complete